MLDCDGLAVDASSYLLQPDVRTECKGLVAVSWRASREWVVIGFLMGTSYLQALTFLCCAEETGFLASCNGPQDRPSLQRQLKCFAP